MHWSRLKVASTPTPSASSAAHSNANLAARRRPIATATTLQATGRNFSVGLAQINVGNLTGLD
jgi:hypothetical protein